MGLLALDNLHYFCGKYNEEAKRILKASHHEQSWFSFAIVGINITAYCLRLVRTRQLQWVFYSFGADKEVFNEVYCIFDLSGYVFDAFEKEWSGMLKPPSVMDFNSIFKNFQINFEIRLAQRLDVFLTPRTKPTVLKIKAD